LLTHDSNDYIRKMQTSESRLPLDDKRRTK